MSLTTLEFTIPSDREGPNDNTCAIVAEAFALALYGSWPGNGTQRKDPERPGSYVCGVGANDYFLHVYGSLYRFSARNRVPAWLSPWLEHRFGARVRTLRGAA